MNRITFESVMEEIRANLGEARLRKIAEEESAMYSLFGIGEPKKKEPPASTTTVDTSPSALGNNKPLPNEKFDTGSENPTGGTTPPVRSEPTGGSLYKDAGSQANAPKVPVQGASRSIAASEPTTPAPAPKAVGPATAFEKGIRGQGFSPINRNSTPTTSSDRSTSIPGVSSGRGQTAGGPQSPEDLKAAADNNTSARAGNYTIKKGDTLSTIAKNTNQSVSDLAKSNNISDPNKIQAGATLKSAPRSAMQAASERDDAETAANRTRPAPSPGATGRTATGPTPSTATSAAPSVRAPIPTARPSAPAASTVKAPSSAAEYSRSRNSGSDEVGGSSADLIRGDQAAARERAATATSRPAASVRPALSPRSTARTATGPTARPAARGTNIPQGTALTENFEQFVMNRAKGKSS